jgi:hypothetical protein
MRPMMKYLTFVFVSLRLLVWSNHEDMISQDVMDTKTKVSTELIVKSTETLRPTI